MFAIYVVRLLGLCFWRMNYVDDFVTFLFNCVLGSVF
jgi:hypothetical protein